MNPLRIRIDVENIKADRPRKERCAQKNQVVRSRTNAHRNRLRRVNYVTSATYAADGSAAGFVNGLTAGFNGVTNSFSYNKRLQPVFIQASAPSATVFNIGYDFHLGNGDNGNVYQLTNNKDNSRSQVFTYDQLNRLTQAQTSNSTLWGNIYAYDVLQCILAKATGEFGSDSVTTQKLQLVSVPKACMLVQR